MVYSQKEVKKHLCLYLWDYTVNHDQNEDKNEKKITWIQHK